MEIHFNAPGLQQLRRSLSIYARRGLPHAGRNALNGIAFAAREEWQRQAASKMTLRNTWTTRSMRVVKARGINLRGMESVVGSVADYMATQEDGGVERKRGKHGVSIPTSVASGEGRGANPRQRLVRRPNRLGSIQLAARPGKTSRQRNAIAISQARASGRKYVFLDLGRRRGIFRVSGGKRRPKIDMVWDLTRPTVRIPATHTLQRTLDAINPSRTIPIMQRALMEQLQRAQLPRR